MAYKSLNGAGELVTKRQISAITGIKRSRLNTAFSMLRKAGKEPAYSLAEKKDLVDNCGLYDPAVIPHLVKWDKASKTRKSLRPRMSISRVEPPRDVKLTPEQEAKNAAILARIKANDLREIEECRAIQAVEGAMRRPRKKRRMS